MVIKGTERVKVPERVKGAERDGQNLSRDNTFVFNEEKGQPLFFEVFLFHLARPRSVSTTISISKSSKLTALTRVGML